MKISRTGSEASSSVTPHPTTNPERTVEALLAVHELEAWYGESHILHGVDFTVLPGEVMTLVGRNGSGKTTTLRAIMAMVDIRRGSVRFEGRELINLPSNR